MCGICGVMGNKLGFGELARFKDLFAMSQIRGDEGAGLIGIPHKNVIGPGDVRVRKTTWSSGHLVTTKDFDEVIKGDLDILIGHARQPTKGGTKIDMVHPHQSGEVTLVHNGTMTTVGDKVVQGGESDSRMIADYLAKEGIQKLVDSSWGAMCLVWVDRRDQTINFFRNAERPLILCEERNSIMGTTPVQNLYWASEMGMLHLCLARYTSFVKERHKFFHLPVNEHWKYPLKVDRFEPEVVEVKRKPYSVVSYHGDDWEVWNDQYPFVPDRTRTNTNSERWHGQNGGGSGTTKSSAGFSYTPPEHRQRDNESIIHSSLVLNRSRREAEACTKLREEALKRVADREKAGATSVVTFPSADEFAKFSEDDPNKVMALVTAGGCVWCEEKPAIVSGQKTRVFPVKFSDNQSNYVCANCITDLDVRRMVGMG